MRIRLNGAEREVPDGVSVGDVVRIAGADGEERGVAVALEGEVVPRSQWERVAPPEGSRIEVLRAVQGG